MNTFINYLKATMTEIKHVSWPTHTQTMTYTILVVVISVIVAMLLSLFDAGFSRGLDWFIK